MRVDDKALGALAALRAEVYRAAHACRDALFELIDATAGAGAVPSLAHLSVAPGHRRGHGSVDAGLRQGTLRPERLRAALCGCPLAQGLPAYAVDVSVVGRGDAECSPERGYSYHASRHSAGKPIVAGWAGPGRPDPDLLWRAYAHRFDLEHTLRFGKERLGWDRARVRTPAQMDRWTWIVLAAYAQLRLARAVVTDRRLPWEKRLPPRTLSPLRVQRSFGALVAALGTPASAPKPCGRSPGRPRGRRSAPAPRTPAVKSAA